MTEQTKVIETKEDESAPATAVRSSLNTALDQVTAKEYLQQSVFPKLEIALNTVSGMAPTLTLIVRTVIGNYREKWRVPEVRYHACRERGASPPRPSQTRAGEEAPGVRR